MKKIEIKDNYAKSVGYDYWSELVRLNIHNTYYLEEHIDQVMKLYAETYHEENKKLYAMECLKKASDSAKTLKNGNSGSCFDAGVDKQSIHNENNLI